LTPPKISSLIQSIKEMNTKEQDTPRIYVGTYRKYNNGSIAGKWLELEDYADKEDFLEACAKLHKDESDPEFMFQDWENLPSGVVGECFINAEVWDWLALDDHERELLAVYQDNIDASADIETAQDNFAGTWNSEKEFAEEHTHQTTGEADFDSMEYRLKIVIDWQATWDSYLKHSFSSCRHNGEHWFFHTR